MQFHSLTVAQRMEVYQYRRALQRLGNWCRFRDRAKYKRIERADYRFFVQKCDLPWKDMVAIMPPDVLELIHEATSPIWTVEGAKA